MAKSKKPASARQGNPARVNRDAFHVEVEKTARRVVDLIPGAIRDPRLNPDDALHIKACAIGMLHVLSVLERKPSPYQVFGKEPL